MRQAIGAYRLGLSVARDIDDPYLQLRALDGLIQIYRTRNEPTVLGEYLSDRIALTQRTGDDWQRLLTLKTMGEIYLDQGEVVAAQDAFRRALALARTLDNKRMQADLSNRLLRLASQVD